MLEVMAGPQGRAGRTAAGGPRPGPRILFVGHSPLTGGAELCLDTLLRHLTLPREDVFVVEPWEGPMAASARAMGYRVDLFPLAWWMMWPHSLWHYKRLLLQSPHTIWRLARYIRQHRIDLVYTNTIALFESAFAARLARVPHVWHVHEVVRDHARMRQVLPLPWIKRLLLGLSDAILYESHSAMKVCEGEKPSPRSHVVYNSLRLAPQARPSADAPGRRRCGIAASEKVVGFIGQFNDRKNPLLLIRALARLKDRGNVRLVFAGEGPLRGEMAALMESLGVADLCLILDFQEDIRWVLEMIDLLVLPSKEESFGLVLVEAGAYGKPVIATRTEGPCEIVVDGETGFLVRPDDPEELAGRMEQVLSGAADGERMGRAAARRVQELFSAPRNAARTEEVLRDVLVRRRRRQVAPIPAHLPGSGS
jgi:glycosyltransferase involved in cell wall biosynthesis